MTDTLVFPFRCSMWHMNLTQTVTIYNDIEMPKHPACFHVSQRK